MAKLVFGFEKHKRTTAVGTTNLKKNLGHALREISCPDADPTRLHLNQHLAGARSSTEFYEKLEARLSQLKRTRKDAVEVMEFVISAGKVEEPILNNPEIRQRFFDGAHTWLKKTFGEEQILLVGTHEDEATQHLTAFVIPKHPDRDELNAAYFADGPAKGRALRTSAWEAFAKPLGIERGEECSKAKHVTTAAWKRAVRAAELDFPMPNFPEPPPMTVKDRVNPAGWAQAYVASVWSTANKVMDAVRLARADAVVKLQTVEGDTARLRGWEKRLSDASDRFEQEVKDQADKIARAALSSVRDELEELRLLREQLPAMKEEVRMANHSKAELLRATAQMIKHSYTGHKLAKLAAELDVPSPTGKADIFDAVQKAGKADSFESAVTFVARHINVTEDIRLSEIAAWSLDYEKADFNREKPSSDRPN